MCVNVGADAHIGPRADTPVRPYVGLSGAEGEVPPSVGFADSSPRRGEPCGTSRTPSPTAGKLVPSMIARRDEGIAPYGWRNKSTLGRIGGGSKPPPYGGRAISGSVGDWTERRADMGSCPTAGCQARWGDVGAD